MKMGSDVLCKFCECKVNIENENKTTVEQSLMNHFSLDHNIKTKDRDVTNSLLKMHGFSRTFSNKRRRSLSQSCSLPTSTPIKMSARTPLKEKSLNITSELPPTPVIKKSDCIIKTPNAEDVLEQVELLTSPICVISSVNSAETLSSSILDSHHSDASSDFEVPHDDDNNDDDGEIVIENKADSSLNNSWLSDENYEVIQQRRLKTTAERGRYVCPADEAECSFKCESTVLLNIHVRKRHAEMFGAPIRKQKMMIYLDPVDIPSSCKDVLESKNAVENYHTETEENNPEKTLRSVRLAFIRDRDVTHHIHNIARGSKRSKPDTEALASNRPTKKIKIEKESPKKEQEKRQKNANKRKITKTIKKEQPENTFEGKTDKERTIEKMRFLQTGKSNGTYVKCSVKSCGKWRYLEGCEDPSLVPDTWQCSMNTNILNNACDKGVSEEFVEDSEEFVDTEYAAGSMVWAKMKGYPWWPALVDFCPDTDEYYWLDSWNEEVSTDFNNTLPTLYLTKLEPGEGEE